MVVVAFVFTPKATGCAFMQERVGIAFFRRRRDCLFAAAFVVIALAVERGKRIRFSN